MAIRLGAPALKFRKTKDKPLTQDLGGGQKKLEAMILHQDHCLRPKKMLMAIALGLHQIRGLRTRGVLALELQNAKIQTF